MTDEFYARPPTTNLQQGQGSHLRGSKRYIPGEISSPSKRRRELGKNTNNFDLENPVSNIGTVGKINEALYEQAEL